MPRGIVRRQLYAEWKRHQWELAKLTPPDRERWKKLLRVAEVSAGEAQVSWGWRGTAEQLDCLADLLSRKALQIVLVCAEAGADPLSRSGYDCAVRLGEELVVEVLGPRRARR